MTELPPPAPPCDTKPGQHGGSHALCRLWIVPVYEQTKHSGCHAPPASTAAGCSMRMLMQSALQQRHTCSGSDTGWDVLSLCRAAAAWCMGEKEKALKSGSELARVVPVAGPAQTAEACGAAWELWASSLPGMRCSAGGAAACPANLGVQQSGELGQGRGYMTSSTVARPGCTGCSWQGVYGMWRCNAVLEHLGLAWAVMGGVGHGRSDLDRLHAAAGAAAHLQWTHNH